MRDAIVAADPYVNFASYDTNGDGEIAPRRAAHHGHHGRLRGRHGAAAPAVRVGPQVRRRRHATPDVDGVQVGRLRLHDVRRDALRRRRHAPRQATLGIIVHELGHDLGWPDLYDTDDSAPTGGVGTGASWRAAAGTRWPGRPVGRRPAASRRVLEVATRAGSRRRRSWARRRPRPSPRPRRVAAPRSGCSPTRTASTGPSTASAGTGEYFLVENRQQRRLRRAAARLRRAGLAHRRDPRPVSAARTPTTAAAGAARCEADGERDARRGGRRLARRAHLRRHVDAGQPARTAAPRAASALATSAPRAAPTMPATRRAAATPARRTTRSARPRPSPRSRTGDAGVSTAAATVEAGEPTPTCGGGRQDGLVPLHARPRAGRCSQTRPAAASTPCSRPTAARPWPACCRSPATTTSTAGGNRRSRAQFAVTAGQTYYLQVGGFKEPSGAVARRDAGAGGDRGADARRPTTPSPPPPRSARCPSAAPAMDTRPATVEAGEPAPTCAALGRSVWFRYVAPATPTSSPTPSAATSTPSWPCYRGTALGALTQVGCNDDIEPASETSAGNLRSRVQFAVTAGQTYYVQVGGYRADDGAVAGGALTLNLAAGAIVAPTTRSRPRWSPARRRSPARAWTRDRPGSEAGEPVPACAAVGAHGLVPLHGAGRRHARRGHDRQRLRHRPRGYRGTALGALTRGRLQRRHRLPGRQRALAAAVRRDGRADLLRPARLVRRRAPTLPAAADVQPDRAPGRRRPTTCSRLRSTRARCRSSARGSTPRAGAAEAGEPTPTCAPLGGSVWCRYTPTAERRSRRRHDRQRLRHRPGRVPGHRAGRADAGRLQRRHRRARRQPALERHASGDRRADVLRAGRRQARAPAAPRRPAALSISLTAAAQVAANNAFAAAAVVPGLPVHARGARHAGGDRRDGRVRAGVHQRHRQDRLVPLHAARRARPSPPTRSAATSTPCSPCTAGRPWER